MSGPQLTVLNCSWGTQSSAIVWMLLNGHLEIPEPFLVLSADPGNENSETYAYAAMMREKLDAAGIEWVLAPGPNLQTDLLAISSTTTRGDFPPYFFRRPDGARGQMPQKCTRHYKLRPMERALTGWFAGRGIKREKKGTVRWIGFAADEYARSQRIRWENEYNVARYPLIEMRLRKIDVYAYFKAHKLPMPPRSVCNFCPANKPEHYRAMRLERPAEYDVVVRVDETIRHIGEQIGLTEAERLFVNDQLEPVEDVAADGYEDKGQLGFSFFCDQGVCFV